MRIKHVSRRFRRFLWANEAVSALEYAILVGVVAVGVGAGVATFWDNIDGALNTIGGQVTEIDTGDVNTAQGQGGGG